MEDEFYPFAEKQLRQSLRICRTAEEETELTLLLLRALAGQQRLDDALILAEKSAHLPHQDAFIYWRARILFNAGHLKEAFQTLEDFPAESAYAPAALRLKGRTAQATGNLKAAQKAFKSFRHLFADNSEAAQNLFDLATVYQKQGKNHASIHTLRKLIDRFPDTPHIDAASLTLARQLIADGGKKERAEAIEWLAALASDKTVLPRLRIAAWTERAALEESEGDIKAAIEALSQAEKLTSQIAQRIRQNTARAHLLIEDGKEQQAFKLFDATFAEAPDSATAIDVLIQKAEALLKTKYYVLAEKAFQSCLNVLTDPEGQTRALSGKGWSLWEQARYEEAAVAFENAAAKSSDQESGLIARIKAGDARFVAKQYDKARENYQWVGLCHTTHPQAARVMYQSGIASLLAGQTDQARLCFVKTEANFPTSEFAEQAAVQLAEIFKKDQQWTKALKEYRRIGEQYTNATLQALYQQGLILYRTKQYDSALKIFQTISETYPDSEEATQSCYMQGFCRYLQGDTETALAICNRFIEKYSDSIWTSEVLFWMAEHDYNRGNYAEAQIKFLSIAEQFPENELADKSLFWAGNALLHQDCFLEAFDIYGRFVKKFPQSPLLLETRFAQGETLTELGEFSRAILAYEEMIKMAPDHTLANRARGRIADCLFTLGSTDAVRYQEALEAYQALYKRPDLSVSLTLQALYKIARCEEKIDQPEEAFTHYMEAVYKGIEQNRPLPPNVALWFTRSAFAAAAIQERQKNWEKAVFIYNRLIEAEVPAKDEAQKQIIRTRSKQCLNG